MKNDKIKQLTIDENKWTTGSLYRDGAYCALGYACKRYGFSDEEMDGLGLPEELEQRGHGDIPEWMLKAVPTALLKSSLLGIDEAEYLSEEDLQNVIPMVNDSPQLSKDEKKSRLKKLFKLAGIDLHFKNGAK